MRRKHDMLSCKSKTKAIIAAALAAAVATSSVAVSGCDSEQESTQETGLTFDIADMDLDYSDRDQDASYDDDSATKITLGDTANVDGSGASANGADVTITAAGTYIISGSASDAQVLVECAGDDKVQLVLDNADITCSDGPAIYVKSADKCFVTLAEGSSNNVSDAAGYTLTDDDGSEEPTAALFSKADLTLNGTGNLTVNGNCNNGIGSKDDLVICGGSYTVTAANDGLRGRDCVKVKDGTFEITSTQDAVKSNNDEDTTRGFIKIDGGTWTVNAGDDAFHAETAFILNDGDVTVEQCYEGYEAVQVYLNGGTTYITASDDAINAASGSSSDTQNADDKGRSFSHDDNAGDTDGNQQGDGQTPPEKPSGDAGEADSSSSDGSSSDNSSTDKTADDFTVMNGQAPDNQPNQGGGQGGDQNAGAHGGAGGGMDADSSCLVQINGGSITLDAQGDGIDSNGSLEVCGGKLIIFGPTSGGDGALDYGTTATITGGSVIALGSSGMAQSFSSGSQAFAMVSASGSAGDKVVVLDSSGKKIASVKAVKDFDCAVVSTTTMSDGTSYTLKVAGKSTSFTASCESSQGGMGAGGPGSNGDRNPQESTDSSDSSDNSASGAL